MPEEAERVRHIFARHLELGSVRALMRDLRDRNIVSRQRVHKAGAIRGGVLFGCGALFYLLRNLPRVKKLLAEIQRASDLDISKLEIENILRRSGMQFPGKTLHRSKTV